MNYNDWPSQNCKILTWNKEDYTDLLNSFTEDELYDMYCFVRYHPTYRIELDFCPNDEEDKYILVYEYICLWLVDIMNDSVALWDDVARILIDAAIAMG